LALVVMAAAKALFGWSVTAMTRISFSGWLICGVGSGSPPHGSSCPNSGCENSSSVFAAVTCS
jgi:hypothetical protein